MTDVMRESPWLTFFLFWILIGTIARICNRIIRSRNIKHQGWPPLHLDADGDFVTTERNNA